MNIEECSTLWNSFRKYLKNSALHIINRLLWQRIIIDRSIFTVGTDRNDHHNAQISEQNYIMITLGVGSKFRAINLCALKQCSHHHCDEFRTLSRNWRNRSFSDHKPDWTRRGTDRQSTAYFTVNLTRSHHHAKYEIRFRSLPPGLLKMTFYDCNYFWENLSNCRIKGENYKYIMKLIHVEMCLF